MAISREQMDRAIDEHFAYEAKDDVEGVLRTLSAEARHDIVGWPGGPTRGRENARSFYQAMFADLADGKVVCTERLYGEDFLVDESVWKGNAPGRPFGLEGKGRPLEFRLLHVLQFTPDGQIGRESVWVDLAAIIRQLPPA
ncbi:MAG: ketosteroid isomerase [Planctomycetota bacterium]|nr:MAG: ketosteroid isomerase [Planctomycetota bacterium]